MPATQKRRSARTGSERVSRRSKRAPGPEARAAIRTIRRLTLAKPSAVLVELSQMNHEELRQLCALLLVERSRSYRDGRH
jgi:hypothetical protein